MGETTRYAWSTNEERYYGDEGTREAALAGAMGDDTEVGDVIYTGEIQPFDILSAIPDADYVIEQMQSNVYEELHDLAEDWLTCLPFPVVADLTERLKTVVHDWLVAHNNLPDFWTVDNVIRHEVTADMLKAPAND